jgi:hypothetical protein
MAFFSIMRRVDNLFYGLLLVYSLGAGCANVGDRVRQEPEVKPVATVSVDAPAPKPVELSLEELLTLRIENPERFKEELGRRKDREYIRGVVDLTEEASQVIAHYEERLKDIIELGYDLEFLRSVVKVGEGNLLANVDQLSDIVEIPIEYFREIGSLKGAHGRPYFIGRFRELYDTGISLEDIKFLYDLDIRGSAIVKFGKDNRHRAEISKLLEIGFPARTISSYLDSSATLEGIEDLVEKRLMIEDISSLLYRRNIGSVDEIATYFDAQERYKDAGAFLAVGGDAEFIESWVEVNDISKGFDYYFDGNRAILIELKEQNILPTEKNIQKIDVIVEKAAELGIDSLEGNMHRFVEYFDERYGARIMTYHVNTPLGMIVAGIPNEYYSVFGSEPEIAKQMHELEIPAEYWTAFRKWPEHIQKVMDLEVPIEHIQRFAIEYDDFEEFWEINSANLSILQRNALVDISSKVLLTKVEGLSCVWSESENPNMLYVLPYHDNDDFGNFADASADDAPFAFYGLDGTLQDISRKVKGKIVTDAIVLADHYDIAFCFPDELEDILAAFEHYGSFQKGMILCGHGNKEDMAIFTANRVEMNGTMVRSGNVKDDEYLDLGDKEELSVYGDVFPRDATIILSSCSTGSGGVDADNLGRMIYEAFGCIVYAPKTVTGVQLIGEEGGKLNLDTLQIHFIPNWPTLDRNTVKWIPGKTQ